jgi:hypothetical protein
VSNFGSSETTWKAGSTLSNSDMDRRLMMADGGFWDGSNVEIKLKEGSKESPILPVCRYKKGTKRLFATVQVVKARIIEWDGYIDNFLTRTARAVQSLRRQYYLVVI